MDRRRADKFSSRMASGLISDPPASPPPLASPTILPSAAEKPLTTNRDLDRKNLEGEVGEERERRGRIWKARETAMRFSFEKVPERNRRGGASFDTCRRLA